MRHDARAAGDTMAKGTEKSIYYFDFCGESNTEKVLELTKERAEELRIKKVVIASETGLSAMKAVKILDNLDIIVVTSAMGTVVENTGMGNLHIGITEKEIFNELKGQCTIVRGTDPFHNINAPFGMSIGEIVRAVLYCISAGIEVCMLSVLMATDHGVLKKGEDIVACAGSFVGLDTACVIRACNSVDFFKRNGMVVEEIICKPRDPKYKWPIAYEKWKGDLENYKRFMKE